MPEQFKKYTDPMQSRWNALTRPQQYKFVGVVLILLVAIIIALYFIFRTNWEAIVNNRDMLEITQMQAVLEENGIRNRINDNGRTLEVPTRDRQRAIIEITAQDRAPIDERFRWADAFTGTGLSTTESQRRRMDTLALEGEIATMLEVVNGVTHALVTLAVPDPHRAFSPGTPATSASVMVRTSRSFTPQEGRNLALIVTRAVPGLELENVEIIDQEARAIFLGGDSESTLASEAQDYHFRRTNLMRHDLQRLLTTFFDTVQAVPSLQFETSYMQNQVATVFHAPDGTDDGFIFTDRDRSEWRGMNAGFEPGLGWNQGGIPGYQIGGGGESYGSRNISNIIAHYLNEEITRTETIGGGGLRADESFVSVIASFNRDIRQADWLAEDEDRTQRDWELFSANQRPARMLNGEDFPDYQYFRQLIASASGIPVENVTLIISEVISFVHSEARVWDWTTLAVLLLFIILLLMLAWFLLRTRAKDEAEEEEREPELSIEDLLVSTQLEEAKDEEIAALDEENYFRESEVKKQIEKFVNEKPEAVASLLRNWLNVEEW